MRTVALGMVRVLGLAVLLFLSRTVGSLISREAAVAGSLRPEQAAAAAGALLLVSLLHGMVLAYPIARSRWHGWRLAAVLFWVYFGVTTLQAQIEAAVFMAHVMPPGAVWTHLASGAINAGLLAPLAVGIMGKWRERKGAAGLSPRLAMPAGEWAWKLAVIAISYVVIYFAFGYAIAWQNPALREFYTQGRMPSMLLLIPLQIFRGLLWATMAVPMVMVMRGSWKEVGLAVGLLFGVLMGALLLVPNPYFPDSVRLSHLLEVATSNFVFGWLLVGVLQWGGRIASTGRSQ